MLLGDSAEEIQISKEAPPSQSCALTSRVPFAVANGQRTQASFQRRLVLDSGGELKLPINQRRVERVKEELRGVGSSHRCWAMRKERRKERRVR